MLKLAMTCKHLATMGTGAALAAVWEYGLLPELIATLALAVITVAFSNFVISEVIRLED